MTNQSKPIQIPWYFLEEKNTWIPTNVNLGSKSITLKSGKKYDIVWKDDIPFLGIMKYKGLWTPTSSSAKVLFTREGIEYTMKGSDFKHMLETTSIVYGTVVGYWSFDRSGSRYYLKFNGAYDPDKFELEEQKRKEQSDENTQSSSSTDSSPD